MRTSGKTAPPPRPRLGRKRSALPVDAGPALVVLKQWLRDITENDTLTTIAADAKYAVSAVSAAMSGPDLPRLRLVQSVAVAAGASPHFGYEVWVAAAVEDFHRKHPAEPDGPLQEFGRAIKLAMLNGDFGPSDILRRMESMSDIGPGAVAPMSRATLTRLLAGATMPCDEQVELLFNALIVRPFQAELLRARYRSALMALEIMKSPKLQAWVAKTASVTA